MITGPFSVSKALSEGWRLAQKHWLILIGLYLGFMMLAFILQLFQGSDIASFRYWIIFLIAVAIQYIFLAGYYKMYLVATDDEEPEFSLFKLCLPRVIPLFVACLLLGLGCVIGFCLLIAPGIWFAIRFCFVPFIIVDQKDCGIIEAFRKSYELTADRFWPLFGFAMLNLLVYLAGLIAFVVGVFFTMVICGFAYASAYRMLQDRHDSGYKEIPVTETTEQ